MKFKKTVAFFTLFLVFFCFPPSTYAMNNETGIFVQTDGGTVQIIESNEDYQIVMENNVITVKVAKVESLVKVRVFWQEHTLSMGIPTMEVTSSDFPPSINYEVGDKNKPGFISGRLYLDSFEKIAGSISIWDVTYDGRCAVWD